MDPVTQGALGAACAQAVLGNRDKIIPWLVGALAGMAADLDVLLRFSQEPLSAEIWHRQFSHSLTFIPLGGLVVALCLLCIPYFRQRWRLVILAALIGYATHGLLDAFTSYGTVLLWPWDYSRISWDIVAIIDPVFTLPLIAGTWWAVQYQERQMACYSLLFAALFLSFNALQHHRAIESMEQFSQHQKQPLSAIRAMPALASSTTWRAIAKQGSCIVIAEVRTPLWGYNTVQPLAKFPAFYNAMLPKGTSPQQRHDLAIFSWFADNYLIAAHQNPLTVVDGRYTIGNQPLWALWGIQFLPKHQHVVKLRFVELKNNLCN